MRHITILASLMISGLFAAACTSNADIASDPQNESTGGRGVVTPGTGGAPAQNTGGAPTTPATTAGGGTGAVAPSSGGAPSVPADTLIKEERSTDTPVAAAVLTDAEYAGFITDLNTFGLALADKVAVNEKLTASNGVFSPVSAQLALAMTYAGAAGDTAAAMKATLQDHLGAEKYHAAAGRLNRDLLSRNYKADPTRVTTSDLQRIELAPANSVWIERTKPVLGSFLGVLNGNYDAGIWRADFLNQAEPARLAINAWVANRTHDRIQDLLSKGMVDSSTAMVLVNALYFKGAWASPFQKSFTAPQAFHTLKASDVQASTMHQTGSWGYRATDNAQVMALPYETGKLTMTLVLPNAGAFESVRGQLTGAWVAENTGAKLDSTLIDLSLPTFKATTPVMDLTGSLVELGMGPAFQGPKVDFSGMTGDRSISISKVIQKAFIEVNEDGTEAAAATAVMMVGTSAPGPTKPVTPLPVTFDRPFLYLIQDATGAVLFSGQVVDPTL